MTKSRWYSKEAQLRAQWQSQAGHVAKQAPAAFSLNKAKHVCREDMQQSCFLESDPSSKKQCLEGSALRGSRNVPLEGNPTLDAHFEAGPNALLLKPSS